MTASDLWTFQEPILVFAVILESILHSTNRMRAWRSATFNAWYRLQTIDWIERAKISEKFSRGVDLVYGPKLFSLRRVLSGTLSSILACILVYAVLMLIGGYIFEMKYEFVIPEDPLVYDRGLAKLLNRGTVALFPPGAYLIPSVRHGLMCVWDSLGWNVVPDIISISETAWVIRLASNARSSLLRLAVLDLCLTTLISLTWICVVALLIYRVNPVGILSGLLVFGNAGEGGGLHHVNFSLFWIFILTAYATSALWLGFITLTVVFGFLRRVSSLAVRVLESRTVHELPIGSAVGMVCLASWILYFVWSIGQRIAP